MDKGKIVRLVLIPITIGLVVTLIARQVLSGAKAPSAAANGEMVPVVTIMGKDPVAARTKLMDAQLAVKQVPKSVLTGGEFSAVKDAVGLVTLVQLSPGEILLRSRVVEESKGSLPFRIPAGARAETIRVDEFSGVAGYPEPGDLVDLVFVLPAKQPDRLTATSRMLYESILVLGKGMSPSMTKTGPGGAAPSASAADAGKLTSLTLALQPDEAVEVALAEQLGLIKVLLRPALKEPSAGKILMNETRYAPGAAR